MVKRAKRQKRANNIFAKLLIALGLFIFLLGFSTHTQLFYKQIFSFKEKPQIEVSFQAPIRLTIPSLKLDVGVEMGGIADKEWILSDENALYLPSSGKLGEGFNTIIYAHNKPALFGRLSEVKQDDIIVIKDRTGKEYRYKVYKREKIRASEVNKLYSKDQNIITLFTCDGWADQYRFLVRATRVLE